MAKRSKLLAVGGTCLLGGAVLALSWDCSAAPRAWLLSRDWPATAEAFANLVQIIGIAVAGWWTYRLFVRQRHDRAKAGIAHGLVVVSTTAERLIMRLRIDVTNRGNVVIRPRTGSAILYAVRPEPLGLAEVATAESLQIAAGTVLLTRGPELPWPELVRNDFDLAADRFVLEPGESDVLYADFSIPRVYEAVLARTEICCGDLDDPDLVWREETFHEFKPAPE
jgi:hypothetical protein